MIKTILVPATASDGDLAAFASALSIARAFGAHIDVLHTRLDAVEIAVRMTADATGTPLIGDLIERLEQDAGEREAKAKRLFENFCSGEGLTVLDGPTVQTGTAPTAQWHVETGDEARSITAYGMTADLIVAARGGKNDATARSFLEAALLDTGRPLLIPGEGPAPAFIGETIAIAWKATPQAARAVTAAMPFLALAKEILVVTVEEGEGYADADRLVRNLRWHGFRTRAERLSADDRDPVEALLEAVRAKAGLLVMGGFGHSRLREWVFGGFTQRVLADAPIPVIMTH